MKPFEIRLPANPCLQTLSESALFGMAYQHALFYARSYRLVGESEALPPTARIEIGFDAQTGEVVISVAVATMVDGEAERFARLMEGVLV